MGYEIKQAESIGDSISRIFNEELSEAIHSLENPGDNQEETIHSVRKRIKKIRGLLRLVRSDIGEETFRQENIRYRTIGHMLSHLRDATVMIKTLDKLKEANPDAIDDQVFSQIRQQLVERQNLVSKAFFEDEKAIAEVLQAFKEAQQSQPQFGTIRDSFAALADNMRMIYKRGVKAFGTAKQEPSSHNFHELRKEVKNLWYHTRILTPLWPGLFEAYGHELGILGEWLGEDHDLGVLGQEIESSKFSLSPEAASPLVALIQTEREKVQQQFLPLAKRLFAEKAADFIGRYRLYWGIWRAETNPEPAEE